MVSAMHPRARLSALLLCLALLTACAAPPTTDRPAAGTSENSSRPSGPRQTKTLTIGITSTITAFAMAGGTTTAGGWQSLNEIHSNALVTSDAQSRAPVGRLAERVPSFEDGSMVLLPDGRLRASYALRKGVTWHDGTPFTAADLMFAYQVYMDAGLPAVDRKVQPWMESVEAPDDYTFVINYKGPYYQADSLGPRLFWIHPRHLLQESYEKYRQGGDANEFLNQPYWTTNYVHLGPFRLSKFDPGEGLTFEAYDGYFLGRPKIDLIQLRTFGNENALFASLLAGAVDVVPDLVLGPELGFQLKEQWEKASPPQGSVHLVTGYTRYVVPQWRPNVQKEQAILDPQVRKALYYALDRDALSDALQAGHPELAAYTLLPPGERMHNAIKDALAVYRYDEGRARATFEQAGWTMGADRTLRNNVDGRRFTTQISNTPGGERELAAVADYWRRAGLEVEELPIPSAQTRNNEYRASYPGFEISANYGDSILNRLQGPAASAADRWTGNRGGYEDPRAQRLLTAYYGSASQQEQTAATRALSDFEVANLPLMPLYYDADSISVRAGVKAMEDWPGGAGAGSPYGTYTRNAHMWEMP
jgi:peptide/nickel transport system substrate-binding protein